MRTEIFDRISISKDSTIVNLTDLQISDDEISEIMYWVKKTNAIVSQFDLDNNCLCDEGAVTLSKKLNTFKDIWLLSVQNNNIGKKGALCLFALKKKFPNMEILFHGNNIINVGEIKQIEQDAVQCKED